MATVTFDGCFSNATRPTRSSPGSSGSPAMNLVDAPVGSDGVSFGTVVVPSRVSNGTR